MVENILVTGAAVSVIQSFLFWVIALSALGLGIDRFLTTGFASLHQVKPWLFFVLCGAFVLIAMLGLAITPAEQRLIEKFEGGLVAWGANLACLGHMATIAIFSWWIWFMTQSQTDLAASIAADQIVPISWAVMFELFFVGLWVWIFVYVIARHGNLSKGFLVVSILKATSFWLTFVAFILNAKLLLIIGLAGAAVIFGPLWHLWIAVIFRRTDCSEIHSSIG